MHVELVDSEFYKSRLQNALGMATTSSASAIAETAHLLELLLLETAPGLRLDELEQQLRDATNLDLPNLRRAVRELRKRRLKPFPFGDGKTINPRDEFQRIEKALGALEQQHVLPANEAWFRLELQVDNFLMRALICAARDNADVSALVASATSKLVALSHVALVEQWSRVQREFEPDRISPSFDANSKLLPPKFLDVGSGDLRQKLPSYVIRIKPQLVATRIANGSYTHPIEAIGPARLLAVNTSPTPLERDVLRLDLARGVSRIAAVWTIVLKRKLPALASLLRLELETRLLAGVDVHGAQRELSESKNPASAAVHEALSFVTTIERLGGAKSGLEDVLRRHKLGLEVTLPEAAKEIGGCDELRLQKMLCRFLIEQGVYAEGTKFGPFEADLLTNVRAMATVVEVKLYRAGSRPSERSMRANLAQLQDYMDKRPVRPTRALVIYNMSDVLVVAPNRWIRGRYWICVVNLGGKTGSRRRTTLTLEEGRGDSHLIVGTTNDATTHRQSARNAPSRSTKRKSRRRN